MSLRLTLVSHAPTKATRSAAFPLDEPLDSDGYADAAAVAERVERADIALTSPALRAAQTASALGLEASIDPLIRDLDFGTWAGKTLAELEAIDSADLALWTKDPAAAPHGGESITNLLKRIAGWLDNMSRGKGRAVAVTHAAVIRAAAIVTLEANPRSFWRIDVEPLRFSQFQAHGGRWTIRCLNAHRD